MFRQIDSTLHFTVGNRTTRSEPVGQRATHRKFAWRAHISGKRTQDADPRRGGNTTLLQSCLPSPVPVLLEFPIYICCSLAASPPNYLDDTGSVLVAVFLLAAMSATTSQKQGVLASEEGNDDDLQQQVSRASLLFGRKVLGVVDSTPTTDEARMRLKMDLYLIPLVSLIYLLAFIDRSNIGNAAIAGLLKDLNMHGFDLSISLSIFFISYIVFEIPANLLCKRIGPAWFLSSAILGFGVLTICTGLVRSFSALCGVRFVLGIFEAGIMPALVYYLSRWYTHSELTFRVSLFIISAALAGAFGGLLASAILSIPHLGSLYSWRLIFLIEGMCRRIILIAVLTLKTAPWLSAEEKVLAKARLDAERYTTDDSVAEFRWSKVRLGICNPVVLTTTTIFLLNSITVYGVSFFLPTIVKTIFPEKSVRMQQLLTVPPYFVGAIACALTSFWSWKAQQRGVFMIFCAPLTVVGYIIFLATSNQHLRYGATFLPFLGIFTYGALTNSHVAANVASDTARTAAIAVNVMGCNIGGLVSAWAYVPSDSPNYRIGNGLNLAAQASMIVIATGLYYWIKYDNKRRDDRQANQPEDLDVQDMDTLDWKHPRFRWRK
ncbi:MFS transporter, putative [Cordyceps militaris CM01]|uniref:MFS transporter, putative n=1 Tax=Cordyceps militaris (strain CM01) TaxID=983644 RepID=G3J2X2_CORMM|nr:MFS transporter, putative [Cordyceps militaris CM01]EGX97251.1 MFS transporter, putative [Cordyceps militaris CM01]